MPIVKIKDYGIYIYIEIQNQISIDLIIIDKTRD